MYKYHYNIYPDANESIYYAQKQILSGIPEIVVEKELHDVDDSRIQIYFLDGKKIKLICSTDVGAVYMDTDIDVASYVLQQDELATAV